MSSETAYAKINLALHVRRRRSDGYHDLESLFAFARDGDVVSLDVPRGEGVTLSISGPFSAGLDAGEGNLVVRAARGLADAFGIEAAVALRLEKNLPVAAGIGGGSADAAAAIRLLARHWMIDLDDRRVAALAGQLGADVPACVASQTLRGDARGDVLTGVEGADALSGMPLLLVNPRIPLGTGEVFARWDGVDRGALAGGDALAAAISGRNDLEDPAIMLVPEIGDVLDFIGSLSGVVLARMSGSGATCFALFESEAALMIGAAMVGAAMPDAWVCATALR